MRCRTLLVVVLALGDYALGECQNTACDVSFKSHATFCNVYTANYSRLDFVKLLNHYRTSQWNGSSIKKVMPCSSKQHYEIKKICHSVERINIVFFTLALFPKFVFN